MVGEETTEVVLQAPEVAPELPQNLVTKVVQKETSDEKQKATQVDHISNKQVLENKVPEKKNTSSASSTIDQSSGNDDLSELSEEGVSHFIFFWIMFDDLNRVS